MDFTVYCTCDFLCSFLHDFIVITKIESEGRGKEDGMNDSLIVFFCACVGVRAVYERICREALSMQ